MIKAPLTGDKRQAVTQQTKGKRSLLAGANGTAHILRYLGDECSQHQSRLMLFKQGNLELDCTYVWITASVEKKPNAGLSNERIAD